MASKRIQKWIEDGEEVKTNLAALIELPLLVNSESQPELAGDPTDDCTDGTTRKRVRKLTAVMQESQEQQKSDNENRALADKAEKAPAKKGRRTTRRPTISILEAATKRTRESNPRKGQ